MTETAGRLWLALLTLSLVTMVASIGILAATPDFLQITGLSPATCLPSDCFAEQVRQTGLKQPANTWSSLSFVLASAALSWIMLSRDPRRDWLGQFTLCMVIGSGLVTAVGSAFYHATLTFLGQSIDVFGMTLFGLTMVLYAGTQLLEARSKRQTLLVFGVSLFASTALFTGVPATRRWLFGALIALGLLLEMQRYRNADPADRSIWSLLLAALAVFVFGYVFWLLDNAGIGPSPTSPLQGHTLWHVAGALALFLYGSFVRGDPARLGKGEV